MTDTPPRDYVPGPAGDPWATSTTAATSSPRMHPPQRSRPQPQTPVQFTTRSVLLGVVIGLSILLVAAVGIGAFVLFRNDDDQAVQNASPQVFALTGTLVLAEGYDGSNAACSGRGGYRDISAGTQVTVTDEAGAAIALGQLGTGQVRDGGCTFDFTIQDVPADKNFYGVEVSHRGVVRFTAAEAKSGGAKLTLG